MQTHPLRAAHAAAIRCLRPAVPIFSVLVLAAGCGGSGGGGSGSTGGGGTGMSSPPTTTVKIGTQPTDQSVPMGLKATFSVTASATAGAGAIPALQYQWFDNGQAISGATDSTYTTPATMFTDSGSQYTVTVSASGVSSTSTPAELTVTARAPSSQDLRFQLVDAPSTVTGYMDTGPQSLQPQELTHIASLGTPLWLGAGCLVSTATDPQGCPRQFELLMPAQAGSLVAGYSVGTYDLGYQILNGEVGGDIPADWPVTPSSVVTSLDLDTLSEQFGLSWVQDPQQTNFDLKYEQVDPTNLSAAIAQDAAASRVVTAISFDDGQVTFLSYGWQGDVTSVYETQVNTVATPADAAAAAATLAQQGYILTAYGRADATGTGAYYLVGTRVAGDTMERPFMTSQAKVGPLAQQGYAIVAVINDPNAPATSNPTFVGER